MCFSAGASFGATVLLGTMGMAAITKAKNPPQRLLATIPLLFAVQQLAEGFLWLSLDHPGLAGAREFFTYGFLVFAMMVWPVWLPLVCRGLEKNSRRVKFMQILLGAGILISLGMGIIFLLYPVQATRTHHHLHYILGIPFASKSVITLFSILYFTVTVISPLISGVRRMKWLGVVFMVSYLAAIIFYPGFIVSVWCYFAALLSIVVLWILAGLRERDQ